MKTIEELEREADLRKAEFEAKVDEIRERLMPKKIAEEALRTVSAPGSAAADAMLDAARRSPVLALTLAAGAGWLILKTRGKSRRSKRARSNDKRLKEVSYVNARR
jgi:hypothetical protein